MLIKDSALGTNVELQGIENKAYTIPYVYDEDTLSFVVLTKQVAEGGGGDATAAHQVTQNASLQSIDTAVNSEEAQRIDESSATVTYVGLAAAGSGNASAVWKIKKIEVSGTVTTISWADGNTNYDNVWNNRASLSYS